MILRARLSAYGDCDESVSECRDIWPFMLIVLEIHSLYSILTWPASLSLIFRRIADLARYLLGWDLPLTGITRESPDLTDDATMFRSYSIRKSLSFWVVVSASPVEYQSVFLKTQIAGTYSWSSRSTCWLGTTSWSKGLVRWSNDYGLNGIKWRWISFLITYIPRSARQRIHNRCFVRLRTRQFLTLCCRRRLRLVSLCRLGHLSKHLHCWHD